MRPFPLEVSTRKLDPVTLPAAPKQVTLIMLFPYWFTGLEAAPRPVRMEGETISPSKPPPSWFQGLELVLVDG